MFRKNSMEWVRWGLHVPATWPGVYAAVLIALLSTTVFFGCPRKKSDNETGKKEEAKAINGEGAEKKEGEAEKTANTKEDGIQRHAETGDAEKRVNRKLVYELYMGENKIGTLTGEESYSGDEVTTTTDALMSITRAGLNIEIRAYETFREKLSGTPVSFKVIMDQKVSKMESRGVYKDGVMTVTDSVGTHEVKYDEKWLFPYAAGRVMKAKGFKPGTKYSYLKFQPQFGNKGVSITHEIIGPKTVTYKGRKIECHEMRVTSPLLPAQTVCVDDSFLVYEMDIQMGGITLTTRLVEIDEP